MSVKSAAPQVVVIQMRTLAPLAANGQTAVRHFFGVEGPARFHALQHAHQSFTHVVFQSHAPSDLLFVRAAGIQIAITIQLFCLGHQRCRHKLLGDLGSVGFELATADVIDPQQNIHPVGPIEFAQLAFEDQPIKPLQDTGDDQGKLL